MGNVTKQAEPTEVLHLSIEKMHEGMILLSETIFGSDHRVFCRVSRRLDDTECTWEAQAWQAKGSWETLEQLERVAGERERQGFRVWWHPFFAPHAKEFIKEVSFS